MLCNFKNIVSMKNNISYRLWPLLFSPQMQFSILGVGFVFNVFNHFMHFLFSPVNFLDHTQHKGLAVAVYGVLFCKLVGMVLSHHPLPFTKDVVNKGAKRIFLA